MQNTEAGNGPDSNPKVGDVAYIRDRYFQTVYDQANSAMTATSPMSTLRGKKLILYFTNVGVGASFP